MRKKICKKCCSEKTTNDFYKDKSKSDGLHPWCKHCQLENKKDYYKQNKQKIIQTQTKYYIKNKDKILKNVRERNKSKYWENPQQARLNSLHYWKLNPEKNCLNRAAYRSRQLKATAKWNDKKIVFEIYKLAKEFRNSGINVHVDHIIPLKGKNVCGLHVHNNLRICLAETNLKKSNKYFENDYA